MPTTRFKGATAGERLDFSAISDGDMIQVRHKPGTIEDADKGISKSQLQSCPFGVSDTAAGTGAKVASLTDSNPDFTLVSGREVVVCFTVANTALNPTLNFAGSGAVPLYMPNGAPVGAWNAGAWMHLKYFSATVGNSQIQRWILMSQEVDNEVIMASSTTINGKSLISGSSIKIMFTADITGSNTTTGLSLTYNGTAYAVKVGKNGALANFNAYEVSSGVFKYLQAYTTLELAFDGTQFIIIGNPVVLSSADYTIYPDGAINKKSVDWVLNTSKVTTQYFDYGPMYSYCVTAPNIASNTDKYSFILPMAVNALVNFYVTAVDASGNVIQNGYYDASDGVAYNLRAAYFATGNFIFVTWTGWHDEINLRQLSLFMLYR